MKEKKSNTIYIIIQDIIRQLIVFNIVIYYLTTYFSKSWPIKMFVIGSSIFSYIITYTRVLQKKQDLNFSYKYFAINEPVIQGTFWTLGVYILHIALKYKLINSLFMYQIISSIIMLIIAVYFKMYQYRNYEWFSYFMRLILVGFIKIIPVYYLLTELK